ncbi:hypothetical protein Poly30_04010 [Planctomycetes bacterium Poly30]|uniref:Uncharacterized protein n=1 Tax=Saltatorellus ferox TaxID=2528018 RepID=A0A518ELD1_9BACT|nr:hypothetical protein Poly30_04010 [Planctomycetes bacterium Poly30]
MSSYEIRLIPEQPALVPGLSLRMQAIALARSTFPGTRDVTFKVADGIQLVDCGGNLDHIRCPECGADLQAAWSTAMDAAYDGDRFQDLGWTTPCCDHGTTLHDLDYDFPMGFARATLAIADPCRPMPQGFPAKVAGVLGCDLRLIQAND